MANITACGSLFLDDTDFKVVKKGTSNIVTDVTAQSVTSYFKAPICGLGFDEEYFKNLSNCVSVATATSASNTTGSPCSGTVFDSAYFTLTGSVLSYGSGMNATLTFTLSPTGTTLTLKDGNDEDVTATNNVADVILGRTYSYECSKTGYVTETGSIKIGTTADTKSVTLASE